MSKKNTVDQFAEFASAVVRSLPRDLSPQVVQSFIEHQRFLADSLDRAFFPHSIEVVVDYDRPIEVGIAAGNYVFADPAILADKRQILNVSQLFSGKKCIRVFFPDWITNLHHLPRRKTASERTGDIQAEIHSGNERPVTLQELLAIGEQFPALQRAFNLAALGSIGHDSAGRRAFPVLAHVDAGDPDDHPAGRVLYFYEEYWDESWRIPIVGCH